MITPGQPIEELDTPCVLVDLDVLEDNVARMALFAAQHGVHLRPHAKSHKTQAIAAKQRAAGATGLTVAKLDEAEAFLRAGFDDLLVANEVVGVDKWERLTAMQARGRVAIGIDSVVAAEGLNIVAERAQTPVPVLIEVDSGLARAGVEPGEAVLSLAEQLTRLKRLTLRGIFTHAGHAYGAATPQEVQQIGQREGEQLVASAELLRQHGIPCDVVSVGSTPTALHSGAVGGVTEIRPGNYVFYDRMQVGLGVTSVARCALTVLTRVISRPTPTRVVLDAGSKSFALDRGAHGLESLPGYGQDASSGLVLQRLSEEHAIAELTSGQHLAVGSRLRIVPNHACTVANLTDQLVGVRSGHVSEVMPVLVRGGGR